MIDNKKPQLIYMTGKDKYRKKLGLFKCGYCGKEWETRIQSVETGYTKSCGCLQKEITREIGRNNKTHGLTNTVEFTIWNGMIQRCYNENNKEYPNYGGRGIQVCPEWKESFVNFFNDMGRRPGKGLYIERIDNNGNYCKENCKWATAKEEANNKRNNVLLNLNGRVQTQQQWADELGISTTTIGKRLKSGWTDEEALTEPVKPRERLIEFNGKTQTLSQWANEIGMSVQGLIKRLDVKKLPLEEALTAPVQGKGQMITYNNKTQNLAAWSKELGINLDTLTYRLKVGKPLDEVFLKEDTRTRKRK